MTSHSFDVEVANEYGVYEAIIISNFQFWINKNIANNTHLYDGRYWTYNTVGALVKIFPYFSAKVVRSSIESLVNTGVLMKGNYNQKGFDRTIWYAFVDQKKWTYVTTSTEDDHLPNRENEEISICPTGKLHLPNREIAFAQQGKAIPDSKPDSKPDIKNTCSVDILFERFWASYPKKQGKSKSFESFKKLKPDEVLTDHIIERVSFRKLNDPSWIKDGGQFVPMPTTYLNQKRWEDEITTSGAADVKKSTIANRSQNTNMFNNYLKDRFEQEFTGRSNPGLVSEVQHCLSREMV